ncbi:hypothetical protein P9597_29010 [Aneurinibacillus migulanus]|uniref:hypothetical protein n=1 Tax=Aneurinibacillus migulanus TaxID=47500 RepID=UPI002E1D644D|nr:hypothetical protein [Aneurinibacillus migulanus]
MKKIRGWKKTRLPFFCWSAGRIHPLLFLNRLLPTTLSCQNIKCNLYMLYYDDSWYTRKQHPGYQKSFFSHIDGIFARFAVGG